MYKVPPRRYGKRATKGKNMENHEGDRTGSTVYSLSVVSNTESAASKFHPHHEGQRPRSPAVLSSFTPVEAEIPSEPCPHSSHKPILFACFVCGKPQTDPRSVIA